MKQIDISTLAKTAVMMGENQYWELISSSLQNSTNESEQEEYLINQLSNLSPEEMIGFRLRTDKLLHDTYSSEMWCAGYIINRGCSDDGFEYFRNWVISRGKETYYKAKENPDSLVEEINGEQEEYEFESFWYVALEAFSNRTGKGLYDYIDYEHFNTREGNYPGFEHSWEEDQPETMQKICPKLFEKRWN